MTVTPSTWPRETGEMLAEITIVSVGGDELNSRLSITDSGFKSWFGPLMKEAEKYLQSHANPLALK